METIIEEWLMKKYEGVICRVSREKKEDLKLVGTVIQFAKLALNPRSSLAQPSPGTSSSLFTTRLP
jgi:hypothetical protein